MSRVSMSVLAVGFAFCTAATTWACDKEKSGCSKGGAVTLAAAVTTESTAKAEGGCCIDKGVARVMKSMPHMTYKIGEFSTPCCETATAKAKDTNQAVIYVVNGEEFKCRMSAMDKLAGVMKEEMPKLAQVVSMVGDEAVACPMTAAKLATDRKTKVCYQLAGVDFDCPKHAHSVAAKVAAMIKEGGSGCAAGCSKAQAEGCCKKSGEAKTASAIAGCCSKSKAEATTASAEGGCSKSKAEATTASASAGCCSKNKAEAKTASAEGGCSKSKAEAQTASAEGGCSKSKTEAKTASAETGSAEGCPFSKGEAKTASAETGSAEGGCNKGAKTAAADTKAVAQGETTGEPQETESLARAKQMIRDIVQYVATERESSQS